MSIGPRRAVGRDLTISIGAIHQIRGDADGFRGPRARQRRFAPVRRSTRRDDSYAGARSCNSPFPTPPSSSPRFAAPRARLAIVCREPTKLYRVCRVSTTTVPRGQIKSFSDSFLYVPFVTLCAQQGYKFLCDTKRVKIEEGRRFKNCSC